MSRLRSCVTPRTTAMLLGAALAATAARPVQSQRLSPPTNAWTFTWTVTPTADGTSIPGGAFVLDVAIWQGTVRIIPREGPLRTLAGEGGRILMHTADSSIAIVKPARREALTAAATDLATLMGGPAGSLPLEVSDVSSRTREIGAGARAFGFATRRIEVSERYTVQVSTPTMRRVVSTAQVHDSDVSREIARLDPGFRTFTEQFGRSLGVPAAVRARLRALERVAPAAVPLRVTSTGVTISGTDTLRTTTRIHLTGLQRAAIDTTDFVVPDGYRITELGRLLQQRRRP